MKSFIVAIEQGMRRAESNHVVRPSAHLLGLDRPFFVPPKSNEPKTSPVVLRASELRRSKRS